jgi:hypothetical protein
VAANVVLPAIIDTPGNRAQMPDADVKPLGDAAADRRAAALFDERGRRQPERRGDPALGRV